MYFFGASLAAAHLRVSTCKRGDRISHDVTGPGPNIQPSILITVDGQPIDEWARLQPASEEADGVLLDGNGDIVRER